MGGSTTKIAKMEGGNFGMLGNVGRDNTIPKTLKSTIRKSVGGLNGT